MTEKSKWIETIAPTMHEWQTGNSRIPPPGYVIACTGCSFCQADGHMPMPKKK